VGGGPGLLLEKLCLTEEIACLDFATVLVLKQLISIQSRLTPVLFTLQPFNSDVIREQAV
jgi:hypothetical protein